MALTDQVAGLATAVATDVKTIIASIGSLPSLSTTAKTSLVAAVNELDAAVDALAASGGATNLDQLTDVAVTAPGSGHVLHFNGTTWVNTAGTTLFDAAGSGTAAANASQPRDPDLTEIAALTTQAFGRSLLELANAAALTGLVSPASDTVRGAVELATTAEATTGTDTTRAVTPAGLSAAVNAIVDAAPGTLNTLNELAAALGDDPNFATTVTAQIAGKQDKDATLTGLAGVTTAANQVIYATGVDAFAATALSAFGRTLIAAADAAAARTAIGAASAAAVGDTETDFVAVYNAAKA